MNSLVYVLLRQIYALEDWFCLVLDEALYLSVVLIKALIQYVTVSSTEKMSGLLLHNVRN